MLPAGDRRRLRAVRLRILTWNIHKAIGGVDRRYRPERVAEVIAHHAPDIALLQEVDNGARRSRYDRQFDMLAELLGFSHRVYARTHALRLSPGEYGNAILSHWPLTHTAEVDLTVSIKKRRGALVARCRVRKDVHTRTLHLLNLHLGLSGLERKVQLRRLLASPRFAALPPRAPTVLAGDFNDVYGTLGPKILRPAGFHGPAALPPTFPAVAPVRALDAIWARGHVEVIAIQRSHLALARTASDHLPLIAELHLR